MLLSAESPRSVSKPFYALQVRVDVAGHVCVGEIWTDRQGIYFRVAGFARFDRIYPGSARILVRGCEHATHMHDVEFSIANGGALCRTREAY